PDAADHRALTGPTTAGLGATHSQATDTGLGSGRRAREAAGRTLERATDADIPTKRRLRAPAAEEPRHHLAGLILHVGIPLGGVAHRLVGGRGGLGARLAFFALGGRARLGPLRLALVELTDEAVGLLDLLLLDHQLDDAGLVTAQLVGEPVALRALGERRHDEQGEDERHRHE